MQKAFPPQSQDRSPTPKRRQVQARRDHSPSKSFDRIPLKRSPPHTPDRMISSIPCFPTESALRQSGLVAAVAEECDRNSSITSSLSLRASNKSSRPTFSPSVSSPALSLRSSQSSGVFSVEDEKNAREIRKLRIAQWRRGQEQPGGTCDHHL